jgi:putative salt-induced outer membrane protein YdiY
LVWPAIVLLFACGPLLAAEKTDVVVLRNGDRITGEVKGLEQGKLSFKTDHMGTVSIEWDEIKELTSAQSFEVELETGDKFFGALGPAAEEGVMGVAGESETMSLAMTTVVRIVPIETGFWNRLDGSLDLGFNLTRANRATQLTIGAEARYRTRKNARVLKFNSTLADQQDAERTRRQSLEGTLTRFLSKRRLAVGIVQFQENEELDLELRSLIGAGLGRHVIQTNKMQLNLFAGLALNQEDFIGFPVESSTEAVGGLQFAFFKLDEPETDVRLNLTVYPSLTTSGRVRAEFDARVRREIVKDFFWNISVYDSYDSEPPLEGSTTNDWGLYTSVGWSF